MSEMDELRRELAQLQGYRVVESEGESNRGKLHIANKEGKLSKWVGDTVDQAWQVAFRDDDWLHIPDWPRDAAAALALCLEIADDNDWRLIIVPEKYVSFEAFAYTYSKWMEVDAVYFDFEVNTPAEALARLALAAMKGNAE